MDQILACVVIAFSVLAGGDLMAGASLIASNQPVSGFLVFYNIVFWSGLAGLWMTPIYGASLIVARKVVGFECVMTLIGIVMAVVLSIGLCGVWAVQRAALRDIATRSETERLTKTLKVLEDLIKKTKK